MAASVETMHGEPVHAPEDEFEQAARTLVLNQLRNLLRIIDLEHQGEVLPVDGYCCGHGNGDGAHETLRAPAGVRYDSPDVYRHIEPRLGMIAHLLGNLARCGSFATAGRHVQIDGFRLKDLSYWARYPSARLIDNFGELSTWCSCDCEFCFLHGSAMLSPKRPMLTVSEAETRARYYSVERGRGLPTPSAPPGEPLANPRAIELLTIARASHPTHVLDITTNGDFLTGKMADALAQLKPIHISLSLNSANKEERRRSMRSKRPEVAIRAVPLLRDRGIQFTGSIVPSPAAPLDDVADTMRYLDQYGPLQIRLLLPGFTKYAGPAAHFETEPFWNALVELAFRMRGELRAPLLIQPGYYWNRTITAMIDGIFPNSPAEWAGLRLGDRIVRVGGHAIITRAEAIHFLELPPGEGEPWATELEVDRGGRRFTLQLSNELATEADYYPYKPRDYRASFNVLGRWSFGIQLMDGFDLEPLRTLKQTVERHGARRVVVFTTPLVRDLYVQAMQVVGDSLECRLPDDVELRITIAPHLFWGGNLLVGDLHVVQDYVDHLRLLAQLGYHPDLAIIPNTFTNGWRLDLLGHSWAEIERRTGVPVELLPVKRVMV